MVHGQYVNPGNIGFQRILNSEYIDKTGLIEQINKRINSPEGLQVRIYCRNRTVYED